MSQDTQITVAFFAALAAAVVVEVLYWRLVHARVVEPRLPGRWAGFVGAATAGLMFALGVPRLPWWGHTLLTLGVALAYAYARSALNLARLLGGGMGTGIPECGDPTDRTQRLRRSNSIRRLLASIVSVYLILIASFLLVPDLRPQTVVVGGLLVAPTAVLVQALRPSRRH